MTTLATVITPGHVGNNLVLWLLRQPDLRFTLIEAKPRERAKMEALRQFLASGADRWMLVNHYAAPQFDLSGVPRHPVVTASMNRMVGQERQPMPPEVVPTGCLFMLREVAEKIADTRPFEYQHDTHGNCTKSGDATLKDRLEEAGYEAVTWGGRCINRQEAWV